MAIVLIAQNPAASVVGGCGQGIDLPARARDNPWRSQGGGCLEIRSIPPLLTTLVFQINILIDQDCNARLADFGLVITSGSTITTPPEGTPRWMSPELLDPRVFGPKTSCPTESSDCYALGMVVFEVLSGKKPLYMHQRDAVVGRVLNGERPERPEGGWFTDHIWSVLERCWKPEPGNRPSVNCVLRCLEEASESWTPSLSLMAVVPRRVSPMQSHWGSAVWGGAVVTHSGQPGEPTEDIFSESV